MAKSRYKKYLWCQNLCLQIENKWSYTKSVWAHMGDIFKNPYCSYASSRYAIKCFSSYQWCLITYQSTWLWNICAQILPICVALSWSQESPSHFSLTCCIHQHGFYLDNRYECITQDIVIYWMLCMFCKYVCSIFRRDFLFFSWYAIVRSYQ